MLEIKSIRKTYGDFIAVQDLNLTIPKGEIWGFLGMNGAGKTTTMKMIAGLLKPTQGQILVGGFDVQKDPVKVKQIIGYIPDRPYLYEKLTALEYMYFIGKLYGLSKDEIDQKAKQWLDDFGLITHQHQYIESFSHGMKQRIVMASVLMHAPDLLVVDEPMVGLDPRGAKRLKEILLREKEQRQLTVLLSTHTLEITEELCDQIILIHQGQLIAQGPIQQLKNPNEGLENFFIRLTKENELQNEES
jgi:ABC-2 type transport system ATP-binding protein